MDIIRFLLAHKRCTNPLHAIGVKPHIVPWCDSRACHKCLHVHEGQVLYNQGKILKFMGIKV